MDCIVLPGNRKQHFKQHNSHVSFRHDVEHMSLSGHAHYNNFIIGTHSIDTIDCIQTLTIHYLLVHVAVSLSLIRNLYYSQGRMRLD